MNRTLRLLLAPLTLSLALFAAACDEEPAPPGTSPVTGPANPVIGDDPAVIEACKLACDGQKDAKDCASTSNIPGQIENCKAACAGQVATVPKACAEDAIVAYQCSAVTNWSCFGGSVPQIETDDCDLELGEYRGCINGK